MGYCLRSPDRLLPFADKKTGAKRLLFFCINFAQIIRANVPAQTMTITEMPIKKYFTFHRSAHTLYAL